MQPAIHTDLSTGNQGRHAPSPAGFLCPSLLFSATVADHFITRSGWFSQFPKTTVGPLPEKPPFLHRWTFDLTGGAPHWADATDTYRSEQLIEVPGDMPRVDSRALMERNRHAWVGGMHPDVPKCEVGPMGPPFNSLIHRDDATGEQTFWAPGEHAAPEEPVFVPKSADAGEGEGFLLALVVGGIVLLVQRRAAEPLATPAAIEPLPNPASA